MVVFVFFLPISGLVWARGVFFFFDLFLKSRLSGDSRGFALFRISVFTQEPACIGFPFFPFSSWGQ